MTNIVLKLSTIVGVNFEFHSSKMTKIAKKEQKEATSGKNEQN